MKLIHYLKIVIRNLYRNKSINLINIAGLSLGFASIFFIAIFVINELSYDKFHKNYDRIYRVTNQYSKFNNFEQSLTPYILRAKFLEPLPEIEKISSGTSFQGNITFEENTFSDQFYFTTPEFFEIFDFKIIKGNLKDPLGKPNSAIISESLAKKIFGDKDPLGQTITITVWRIKHQLTINSVMQDFPWNSSLSANLIANAEIFIDIYDKRFDEQETKNSWRTVCFENYILLKENESPKNLIKKIRKLEDSEEVIKKTGVVYNLQPLKDIYMYSGHLLRNTTKTGDLKQIYLFSGIALLILLIGNTNYIILSTAEASSRFKEIGLKKVFGANYQTLLHQFLLKSLLTIFFALPFAALIVWISTPIISDIFVKDISFKAINMLFYFATFALIAIITGLLSGLLIAIYSIKSTPIESLKNQGGWQFRKTGTQKIMIIFQLVIFITLLIGSLTIIKQINYAQNTDLGFNKENVLKISLSIHKPSQQDIIQYLNTIEQNPNIVSASYATMGLPTQGIRVYNLNHFENPTKEIEVQEYSIGYNYLKTLGIKLVNGRSFSKKFGTDTEEACILNETAVRELGIKNPLSQKIREKKIIGIVRDFNVGSFHSKISPYIMNIATKNITEIVVKLSKDKQEETIAYLENEWNKTIKDETFNYMSISDILKYLYNDDKRISRITIIFTSLAILIASLGLFGLTSFIVKKRSKEIGIRKIHGAGIHKIIGLINKEFGILVCAATFISWPIAWYFTEGWLQNFAYRISTPFEIYILSGVIALFIVLTTISIRAYKTANLNPAETIKYE